MNDILRKIAQSIRELALAESCRLGQNFVKGRTQINTYKTATKRRTQITVNIQL